MEFERAKVSASSGPGLILRSGRLGIVVVLGKKAAKSVPRSNKRSDGVSELWSDGTETGLGRGAGMMKQGWEFSQSTKLTKRSPEKAQKSKSLNWRPQRQRSPAKHLLDSVATGENLDRRHAETKLAVCQWNLPSSQSPPHLPRPGGNPRYNELQPHRLFQHWN